MKIAINLIPFYNVQGIEIFSQNIILELLKSKSDEFFILTGEYTPDIFNFPKDNIVKIKGLKSKIKRAFWQQFQIYFLLKKYKIDLLFSPSLHAPMFWGKKIVTIHDCAYDRFSEFDNLFSKIYFKMMFWSAKYFSKKIITVSCFSKKELIDVYKIKPEKIEIIYEGVPNLPQSEDDAAEKILQKFGITKPYFLFIGSSRPRKNIIGLIKAFYLFLKRSEQNYSLIIAGEIDKRFMNLEKEIKNYKLENNIFLIGFVSPEEKTILYKNSVALLFPSFYEGFGLPILEAQSLGIPVLTSNVSSPPEIAGEGALFIDPYNIEEITSGIEKITKNESLRKKLIQKGVENAKRFSWKKSTKKLLKIINTL